MTFQQQMAEWLRENPNATLEQAYRAGYMQSTDNWCRQERTTFAHENNFATKQQPPHPDDKSLNSNL